MSGISIHRLPANAHANAVCSIAARPEFLSDLGDFFATEESRKSLEHPASVVACDATGTVAGFLLCSPQPLEGGECQALLRPAVLPEWRRRGVGTALLAEATARLRRGPQKIVLQALFGWLPCGALAGFAERQGFACVRHFHRMERDATDIAPPQWPEGVTFRPFDGSEKMLASWNAAYNTGFASHFRFRPGTEADCREIAAAEGFAAENVTLAFHGGGPVGLVRVSGSETDDCCTGEIELLCVSPLHRGRGLGRALLRSGLQRLRSSGCTRYRLTADTGSPVAPLLYASEGFRSTKVRAIWERRI